MLFMPHSRINNSARIYYSVRTGSPLHCTNVFGGRGVPLKGITTRHVVRVSSEYEVFILLHDIGHLAPFGQRRSKRFTNSKSHAVE